jgi:glutamate-1-semialdehyde aminotransferase
VQYKPGHRNKKDYETLIGTLKQASQEGHQTVAAGCVLQFPLLGSGYIYVDHGKGGRITDIDGNKYVDYRMGYGPGILGYADSRVDEAGCGPDDRETQNKSS